MIMEKHQPNIIEVLASSYMVLLKRKNLVIITNVIFISLGVIYALTQKPLFVSKMSAASMHLSDGRVIDLIADLDQLIKDRDYRQLAGKLELEESVVERIYQLNAISINEADENRGIEVTEFKESKSNVFSIVAKISDLAVLPDLQVALVGYLANNKYAKRKFVVYIESLKDNIKTLDRNINELDSLTTYLYKDLLLEKGKSGAQELRLLTTSSPSQSFIDIAKLNELKRNYEDQLALASEVEVIQDFTPFSKPKRIGLAPILLSALIIANVFALLLVMITEAYDKIKNKNESE